jgi:hypothetical protein
MDTHMPDRFTSSRPLDLHRLGELQPLIEHWRDPIKGPADLAPHAIEVLGVVRFVPGRSGPSR